MKLLIFLLIIVAAVWAERPAITVVTENFKPFNYLDSTDSLIGPSTKIVQKLLDSCGYNEQKINVYPWARAYNMALDNENVLIFSMVRTQERDPLFSWIGRVGTIKMGAIKLRSRTDLQLDSIAQLRKHKISTFIDSPFDGYLKARDISVSNRVGNYISTIKLLVDGRVDVVPASIEGFLSTAEKEGYPRELFEVALRFPELEKGLWAAFSNRTSATLVNEFREAYKRIVADSPNVD